ncbi:MULTISPECIES: hypothetical protein [Pacificimonas]|nr:MULTISPECIES: hypothetical protein [Pacificimonas]MBZ6380088.1 hypothetical protein [Pacificimonas aurantium]
MGGIVEQIASKDLNVLQQSLAFVRERNTAENERGKAAEARATAMLAILGILAGFIVPLAQTISAADGGMRWSLIAALLSSLTFLVKGLYHALGVLSVAKQYRLTVDTVLDFQTLSRAEALREEIAGLVWECRQAIKPNSLKLFRLHRCQRSALTAILLFMLFGLLLLAAQQQWFVSVGFAYAIAILALAALFLADPIVERQGIWRREAIKTDLPAPGKSQ